MPDARQLVESVRGQLREVEAKIAAHPYLAALEEGRLPKDQLRIFAGEQHYIINSDLRSVALLANRHSGLAGAFFLGALQGEVAAREALSAFAAALSLSEADLRAYEPMPAAQAYPSYIAWVALYTSAAEVAAAFLLNLPAWGANCGRMSAALRKSYGLGKADVAFFDLFAATAPNFQSDALAVIDEGLAHGADPKAIARAARLVQAYELMFWDAVHQASLP